MYGNVLAPTLAYLKVSLYASKINATKTINSNLDDFLKITQMFDGTEYDVDEVSQVMILMNVLSGSFHVVKNAFQFTDTCPSLDVFCIALRTRENEIKHGKSNSDSSLFVKHKGKNKFKKSGNDEAET